jgi:hypothetical protein
MRRGGFGEQLKNKDLLLSYEKEAKRLLFLVLLQFACQAMNARGDAGKAFVFGGCRWAHGG